MNRFSLVCCAFVGAWLSPLVAHADEDRMEEAPPAPPPTGVPTPTTARSPAGAPPRAPWNRAEEDLASFRAWVAPQAGPERAYRWIGVFSGLGIGAALVPAGAVLYSREGSAASGLVLGFGVGALVGGLGALVFGSDPNVHDRAEQAMAREVALGHDPASVLAAGEGALQRAADDARSERVDGGGLLAGLGVIALGWGTTFAAADFTSDSFSRRQQDGVAAALLVGGAVSTVMGLRSLVLPSAAEVSWQGYNQTKRARLSQTFAPTANANAIGFQATPLPGGGASAGIVGRF